MADSHSVSTQNRTDRTHTGQTNVVGGGTLSIDSSRMRIRSVITTIDPDRSGDIVVPTGLRNAEEYLLNPVVLWAHNRSQFPPIGSCAWLDIQPRRIVAETHFAEGFRLADDVFRLYEQGVLRGWSIGFLPRKTRPITGPACNAMAMRIEEWDLLEYSSVPIPENPGALTVALQKGLVKDPELRDWLAQIPDDAGGKVWPVKSLPGDLFGNLISPYDCVHSE